LHNAHFQIRIVNLIIVIRMSSVSRIALSGMNAAQTTLNSTAHNIANLNTPGFQRQEVVQSARPEGGVSASVVQSAVAGASVETDVVAQLQAKNSFLANLAVFKTGNQLAGALFDTSA
jgi:flagellar hook-associated protein FlgK